MRNNVLVLGWSYSERRERAATVLGWWCDVGCDGAGAQGWDGERLAATVLGRRAEMVRSWLRCRLRRGGDGVLARSYAGKEPGEQGWGVVVRSCSTQVR
jgi:hypothetical protein